MNIKILSVALALALPVTSAIAQGAPGGGGHQGGSAGGGYHGGSGGGGLGSHQGSPVGGSTGGYHGPQGGGSSAGHQGSPGGGSAGGYHGPQGGSGSGGHQGSPGGYHGQPNPDSWSSFHHNESPARIYPHRYGNTNFPTPNHWHGDVHNFDRHHWSGGHWRHEHHDGRWGWWWIVGPSWYFYEEPVYPYPDMYTPPGEEPGWWYWCDVYQEYYPYVTFCPDGWQRVLPRD